MIQACPITGSIFGTLQGEHKKCPNCPHCLLCDHHQQTEKRHTHYQDYQRLNARIVPTTYHGKVCEVGLCYCVEPDPFMERCERTSNAIRQ